MKISTFKFNIIISKGNTWSSLTHKKQQMELKTAEINE